MITKKYKALFWLIPAIFISTGITIALLPQENMDGPEIVVYKSPTCGCCRKWVTHLRESGFNVKALNMQNVNPIKQQQGVTPKLASCHTGIIGGYTIEGHVPAKDIHRLLKEKPKVKGLTVSGMPVGSPGMEQGNRKDPYAVLSFQGNGKTTVFSSYR